MACRRAAYEERRAAARGAVAVREVERVKIVEHDLTECMRRASLSPTACRRLVKALSNAGEIVKGSDPRWDPVRHELFLLVRSMVLERREYRS